MRSLILLLLVGLLNGCADENEATAVDSQKALQLQFMNAKPGDIINIPAGHFEMTRSLSLKVDGVTVRGAGMDKTILSFKNQVSGAEGILVTANDFLIEDLAIEDAKGDALKINEGKNITIRRVRTEWTGGPATENGAYGIYPVQTENVLIEVWWRSAPPTRVSMWANLDRWSFVTVELNLTSPVSKLRIRWMQMFTIMSRPIIPAVCWCSICLTCLRKVDELVFLTTT